MAASSWLLERQQRIFVDEFGRDLTRVLSERDGGAASAVALHAVVMSAVGCIEVATMAHLRNRELSVRALFDEALSACRASWSALP